MTEPRPVGRPRNVVYAQPHWRTRDRLQRNAERLAKVMEVIKVEFGTIRAFLNSFTENESVEEYRSDFIKYGAPEVVPLWVEKIPKGSDAFIDVVANECDAEITSLLKEHGSMFRSMVADTDATDDVRTSNAPEVDINNGGKVPHMGAMEAVVKSQAGIAWKMVQVVATGVDRRKKGSPEAGEARRDRMVFCAMMILLYTRSQQMHAFQTMMGILLARCHTTKAGLEIIHGTGFCGSYRHNLASMRKIAEDNKVALKHWVRTRGGKVNLDNVNRKVGVRDGPGTTQAVMDNSTGGFVSPLVGLPPSMTIMPREWVDVGKRVDLNPRELGLSKAAGEMISKWGLHMMEATIANLMFYKNQRLEAFHRPVIGEIFADITPIYSLSLMDYEQQSIEGNLECIR